MQRQVELSTVEMLSRLVEHVHNFTRLEWLTELQGMLTQIKIFNLKKKIKILINMIQRLKMIQSLFKLVNLKQKNQESPQLERKIMSQFLQEQEVKLSQLQQEPDSHLDQILK